MTDDGNRFAILFSEGPAENGIGAHHRVIVARHPLNQCELGLTVHGDVRIQNRAECREPGQHLAARAEVQRRRGERKDVAARTALTEHHEFLRVGDGKGPEQDDVGQGEDCDVRADAEREGRHRDRGKHRIPAQAANGVLHVATEILEPGPYALLVYHRHCFRALQSAMFR